MGQAAFIRQGTTIDVVTSDALTADTTSTTAPTVVSAIASGNADGCEKVILLMDITSTSTQIEGVQIFAEWSDDGTDYTGKEYCQTISTSDNGTYSDGEYAGILYMMLPYCKLYMQAIDYAGTASLDAIPVYYADA